MERVCLWSPFRGGSKLAQLVIVAEGCGRQTRTPARALSPNIVVNLDAYPSVDAGKGVLVGTPLEASTGLAVTSHPDVFVRTRPTRRTSNLHADTDLILILPWGSPEPLLTGHRSVQVSAAQGNM